MVAEDAGIYGSVDYARHPLHPLVDDIQPQSRGKTEAPWIYRLPHRSRKQSLPPGEPGCVANELFDAHIGSLRVLFREHNLLAGAAGIWAERIGRPVGELIHAVQKKADEERRTLLQHREQIVMNSHEGENFRKAAITLPRGDEMFSLDGLCSLQTTAHFAGLTANYNIGIRNIYERNDSALMVCVRRKPQLTSPG